MIKHNYLWKSISYFDLHKRIDFNQMKTKNTTPVIPNNHGYVPLLVSISLSFPLLWLITWFLFRITRSVQLMKEELHIIPEHSSSPTFVSGDDFALILIFCVVFCRLLLACSPFFYSPLYCISVFDLWLLITTLTPSNVLFMYDVMQIYTLLLFTKTKYGINKTCTINQYQGIPNYILYILNHM
jgi:hypothetical protein